jgi:hypothetical protein
MRWWSAAFVLVAMPAWSIDVASAEQSAPSAPPRLWKVTGGGIPADRPSYILGITHLGLPSEYDEYLTRVVLPAASTAEELIYEGAGGGRDVDSLPPCPATLEVNPDDPRIKAARKVVEYWWKRSFPYTDEAVRKAGLPPIPRTTAGINAVSRFHASHLSELGLIGTMRVFDGMMSRRPAVPPAYRDLLPRGSVVAALSRAVPEGTRVTPADTEEEFDQAYCAVGAARLRYFQARIREYTPAVVDVMDWKTAAKSIGRLDLEFRVLLATGRRFGSLDDFPQADQSMVCDRNKNWMAKFFGSPLPQPALLALGASHLYPVDHDGVKCNGLLKDLQARGLTVEIVR